jgi:peptide/nickel transport system substrate-binding protein
MSIRVCQLDDAGVNAAIDRAKTETDPTARAAAWGQADRAITVLAPAVPLVWDKVAMASSADVAAVANEQLGVWDFSFTALR